MENAENITSEEELIHLHNEGKISEAEYNELLGAMKARPAESKEALPETEKSKSKSILGKRAFILMLAAIFLPILILGICILTNTWISPMIYKIVYGNPADIAHKLFHFDLDYVTPVCFALWAAMEAIAFVLGVIAWPDTYGKATVASICVMFVISLLIIS